MNDNPPDEISSDVSPERAMNHKRTWVVAGCLVLVLALGVGLYLVLNTNGGSSTNVGTDHPTADGSGRCDETSKKTGVTKPDSPPKDGAVKVVEEGVEPSKELGDDDEKNGQVGVGAVLKNTSDLVARDVHVTLTGTWETGKPALHGLERKPWKYGPWNIGSLQPDQEFGFGYLVSVLNESQNADSTMNLNVEVEVQEWWQPENDVHEFASITAEIDRQTSGGELEFSVDSQYCESMGKARAAVLYRDSDGDIIGGWMNLELWRPQGDNYIDTKRFPRHRPGTTKNVLATDMWLSITKSSQFSVEPEISKTGVYPYFDPNAKDQ